ncbi:hypothetical protein BpHYR1_024587, partial [Brachionus plicatilis]
MQDFKDWCEQNSSIPEEEDTVFVGHFEYEAYPNQFFRVFLTTKMLVKFALEAKFILSDATYKLTYGNFPAITGGTTDRAKKFHPFGLALCTSEKEIDFAFFFKAIKLIAEKIYNKMIDPRIVIADNAEAIANGFEQSLEVQAYDLINAPEENAIFDDDLTSLDDTSKRPRFDDSV